VTQRGEPENPGHGGYRSLERKSKEEGGARGGTSSSTRPTQRGCLTPLKGLGTKKHQKWKKATSQNSSEPYKLKREK